VDTQTISQSLAYISWELLWGLSAGAFALAWLLRQATDATSGYLAFTATLAATLGILGLVVDLNLPDPAKLAIVAAPALDTPRRSAMALAIGCQALAGLRFRGGRSARVSGSAAIVLGLVAFMLAAVGWAGDPTLGIPLLVQLVTLGAVSGGSLAAVVLGHWYLVTPRISERPLVLTTSLLAVALSIQLLLFLTWVALGGPESEPFAVLTGSAALLVWLRLIVGIVFPLVLAIMAHRTALTRSMESATGLLYIELAAVLASTIVAAGLAFGTGTLV
jgi:hypothetical protein